MEGAEEQYGRAEKLYQKEKDDLGLANTLKSRGDLLRRLGKVEEAESQYKEAEELYRKEKADLGLANTLQSRGDLLKAAGNTDEAAAKYRTAIKLYEKTGEIMGYFYSLAELYECCKSEDKAEADNIKRLIQKKIDLVPYDDVKEYVEAKISD